MEGCFPSAPRFRTPVGQADALGLNVPAVDTRALAVEEGVASYYADEFNGRPTASGQLFDMNKLTCAHLTYPFGTRLRVVNLNNGMSCEVVVNDRGPFVPDRIVDLSYGAAKAIAMIGPGTAPVRLEVLQYGK